VRSRAICHGPPPNALRTASSPVRSTCHANIRLAALAQAISSSIRHRPHEHRNGGPSGSIRFITNGNEGRSKSRILSWARRVCWRAVSRRARACTAESPGANRATARKTPSQAFCSTTANSAAAEPKCQRHAGNRTLDGQHQPRLLLKGPRRISLPTICDRLRICRGREHR